MGKIPKPHHNKSIIKESAKRYISSQSLIEDEYFLLSLRHLDSTQGNSLKKWENDRVLANAIEVLKGCCQSKLQAQCKTTKFTVYGGFPKKEVTEFKFPNHIPEDAKWARIHINGKHCIIGHIVHNIFYVVFLDGEHKFWKSSK